jgi:hypothetical protein
MLNVGGGTSYWRLPQAGHLYPKRITGKVESVYNVVFATTSLTLTIKQSVSILLHEKLILRRINAFSNPISII